MERRHNTGDVEEGQKIHITRTKKEQSSNADGRVKKRQPRNKAKSARVEFLRLTTT